MYNIQEMINDLNSSNSMNDKKEKLKKYSHLKDLFYYVYSPYIQFNVTSKNLKKRFDLIDYNAQQMDLLNILKELSNREVTGHSALAFVNGFINGHKEYENLIYKIIDKNLEIRIDAKTINKVFPGLIPEFSVALANKYEDVKHKLDFEKDVWYASKKMDGIRCIIRKEGDMITSFGRSGKEFDTLEKVKEVVRRFLPNENFILDGELCIIDDEGKENFQAIIKEFRRKDHTIENPRFLVFDYLTLEEFDSKKSKRKLSQRYQKLTGDLITNEIITMVLQTEIRDRDHLATLTDEAIMAGWEGLILRKDTMYEGKRSNDVLKVKKFNDAEYEILDVEFDDIRYIKDGKDVSEKMLSNVFIEHKGNRVGVGSGFSMDQRRHYFNHPKEIIGKIAKIKYFEESMDQHGNLSLRFPTLKIIHGKKRKDF